MTGEHSSLIRIILEPQFLVTDYKNKMFAIYTHHNLYMLYKSPDYNKISSVLLSYVNLLHHLFYYYFYLNKIETHMDTIPLRVNGREHKNYSNNIKTFLRKGKHGHIITNVMHKCMAHCRIVVWMLLYRETSKHKLHKYKGFKEYQNYRNILIKFINVFFDRDLNTSVSHSE